MKSIWCLIGWIEGIFLGFVVMNSALVLGFIFVIWDIPLGRYIGGLIEENREQERGSQEKYAIRRRQEEYAESKQRTEAQTLARKYPEATKHYFK